MLKHPSLKSVTMVELDRSVIEASKRHLRSIHRGAFDDPRLEVVVGDGLKFLAETRQRFDLIALDLPDPVGPASALYETPFFADCKRTLAAGGVLTLHMGSPVARPERVAAIHGRLVETFAIVRPRRESTFGFVASPSEILGM